MSWRNKFTVYSLIGRSYEKDRLQQAIQKGHHVVVKGRTGVGKTLLLDTVSNQLSSSGKRIVVRLPSITVRQALLQAAEQLHESVGLKLSVSALPPKLATRARMGQRLSWEDIKRPVSRSTVDEALTMVTRTIEHHRCLIVVDSLEVPPTYFDALEELMKHCQVIAAMDTDNRRNRAVRMVSGFPTTIDLRPLPLDASELLIKSHMVDRPLRFTDRKTEALFVRRVAQEGGGVPGAILGILGAAAGEERITLAKVRMIQSEAAVRYLDMTPALVLILAGVMALRYIGKGIGETELIVISGVGTSLFVAIRFLFFAMRKR